jgi:adenine-specific DNA-methyltransferase
MPTLQFKGKVFVQNHHLAVPFHELLPVKAKGLSKTPSLHDNVIVQGDNLAALKALLPTYHGKVKCIYIDPPYNTGNEGWAYNDNVNSPMLKEWLGRAVDREDLTRHDKWCCLMLPRLKLLRELLRDDGAIFVSIDDNEVHRLRCLMDEVFGEDCFIGQIIWKSRNFSDTRPVSGFSTDHEYVLIYGRTTRSRLRGRERDETKYTNPDNDPRGPWMSCSLLGKATAEERPNLHYSFTNPATNERFDPVEKTGWICAKASMESKIAAGRILWPKKDGGRPREKVFLAELKTAFIGFPSLIDDIFTSHGTAELGEIMDTKSFAFPKPSALVSKLVEQASDKDSIILDSFAGSGTTAHAVLALNKEDGGNRRFVLVECEDYADSITAERVRRVIKGVPTAKDENLKAGLGGSFSYFKLGKAMRQETLLDGSNLPDYEALAGYVFFTATGEEWNPKRMKRKEWFIGESRLYDVFLIYEPEVERLKDMALTLDMLRKFPSVSGKNKLVFAPTKYVDQEFLDRYRVTFQQLPFQIYKAVDSTATKDSTTKSTKDTKKTGTKEMSS